MSINPTDFETIKELGTGSFGAVTLVRRKADKQQYALKSVLLTKLSQKEKDSALNEIRLLASIEIPNVVRYKGAYFDQEKQTLCVLMEYADGGDLQGKIEKQAQIAKKGFEETFIWKVAYEILSGLRTLHANNIVHRDIKSANIFFGAGIAKLGDLNVSKVIEAGFCETQTGTPYYTAPEIWKNEKYNSKCDIWSTGCLLYELCMLRTPFRAQDFPGLYRKIIEGVYTDIAPGYSKDLRDLIRACLTVEPEMRPSAADLLETGLLKGISNELTEAQAGKQKIELIDPIKCPRVLRFLTNKLPKTQFQTKKVGFDDCKDPSEESNIKMKKVRSEKNLSVAKNDENKKVLEKSKSKKVIHLPPIESAEKAPKLDFIRSKKKL